MRAAKHFRFDIGKLIFTFSPRCEIRPQESCPQEGRRQEVRPQEGRQEARCQEGRHQEGCPQEGHQEVRQEVNLTVSLE
jgi:hypothetical protein